MTTHAAVSRQKPIRGYDLVPVCNVSKRDMNRCGSSFLSQLTIQSIKFYHYSTKIKPLLKISIRNAIK